MRLFLQFDQEGVKTERSLSANEHLSASARFASRLRWMDSEEAFAFVASSALFMKEGIIRRRKYGKTRR